MKYIIANIGSSSRKYAIYDGSDELETFWYEHSEAEGGFDRMLHASYEKNIASSTSEYEAVGIRIVAPGSFFQTHGCIDETYIEKLRALQEEDPVHIGPILSEINAIRARLGEIAIYGLSDSAFHTNLPPHAYTYGIRLEDSEINDIRRFGYHGFSYASIVRKLQETQKLPEKLVVAHLGSGASIAAIKDGVSIDTSMGFSPLEGLLMQTRSGDIDPAALMRLTRAKKFSPDQLENYLYEQSGLRGISGRSGDMRDLLDLDEQGETRAKLSLDVFAYRVKKYIGAYATTLGGIDMLVMTGTIGECSPKIRARICDGLDYLDLNIDLVKNTSTDGTSDIGTMPGKIVTMKTEEMREMAFALRDLLGKKAH